MKIYPVPVEFRTPDTLFYPSDNSPDFECWFSQNLSGLDYFTERIYLPIFFTAYFKRYGYGKDERAVARLQDFVDTLPCDDRYFCVVQYDDGTLIDWKGKDVKIFAMSGKPEGSIPIPLVCQPHRFKFGGEKDILISFVGRITDVSREVILDWGHERKNIYITDRHHSLEEYCKILHRSKYVLCPRGYGSSSFRISEAAQYGSIPIIFEKVGDRIFYCPYSITYTYADCLLWQDLTAIERYFGGATTEQLAEHTYVRRKLYTFEGVKKIIFSNLWDTL